MRLLCAGAVAFLAGIVGCGGEETSVPDTVASGQIYVATNNTNRIIRYRQGESTPAAILRMPGGPNEHRLHFLFLDVPKDRLYVADWRGNAILVIDNVSSKSGDRELTPDRTITSPQMSQPMDVALDSTRNLLYVCDGTLNQILVLSNANTITGSVTAQAISFTPALSFPHGILLDEREDVLYVTDHLNHRIVVVDDVSTRFPGTVTPDRTIADPGDIVRPLSLRIDASGNLVVVSRNGLNTDGTLNDFGSINVYSDASTLEGSNVEARRIRKLTCTSAVDSVHYFELPHQIALRQDTNECFVANLRKHAVMAFENFSTRTGDTPASWKLTGSELQGNVPDQPTVAGVAVDPTR